MGLFSRKKIISVSSVTVNLAGDNDQINYLQKTITSSVLNGNNLATSLNDSYLNGMGIKIQQAYRYGRDHYSLGLPDGSIYYGIPNFEKVISILENQYPSQEIEFVMGDFNVVDLTYWIEQYLTNTYEWDADFGGMGNPPLGVLPTADITWTIDNSGNVTIIMEKIVGDNFTETISFPSIDFTSKYYQIIYRVKTAELPTTSTVSRDYAEGDVAGTTTDTVSEMFFGLLTTVKTTVVTSINEDSTITTIETTIAVSTVSRKKYFLYLAGSGLYPSLDEILDTVTRDSDYYPVVPLRVNNQDLTDESLKDTDQYITSRRLLNRLNLKFTSLGDKLNENPDIGDIDHAFFVLGISLNSKYKSSQAYLHEFFKYLAQISPSDKLTYLTWYNENVKEGEVQKLTAPPPINRLSLEQDPYNISIAYQYSSYIVKAGSIGAVGTITREAGTAASIRVINEFNLSTELTADVSVVTFRKQISENQYEEVEVCGLEHSNNVYKGHTVNITAQTSLSDPDNEGFLIPLCEHVIRSLGLVDVTQLTFDCMHLVVNSYTETKAKWYQSGIFKIVTIAISIVIAVYGGYAFVTGLTAAMSAAAAAGTSVAWAAATFVATAVGISVGISVGVRFISRYLTPELMLIIQAALVAYALTSISMQYGSTGNKGLPFAQEVMKTIPAVSEGTNKRFQDEFSSLSSEILSNQQYYEDKMKELNDAMSALTGNRNIDITSLMQYGYFNLFETSSEFLTRTLTINPGIISLNTISNYVESVIMLPKGLS